MVRYALICQRQHAFESWFPSSDAYDEQAASGLIACPVCGSGEVSKQVMAPAISTRRARLPQPAETGQPKAGQRPDRHGTPEPAPAFPLALLGEMDREARDMVRALREHVARHADNVGRDFAEEARRIHYGEAAERLIHGEATVAEVDDLAAEGITVLPLPTWPDERN